LQPSVVGEGHQLVTARCGSVVSSIPTSISPLSSAAAITSRDGNGRNRWNQPVEARSPARQNGRSGHSGGPPKVSECATGPRSLILRRPRARAVPAVTATPFWSWGRSQFANDPA
jgi:hypothetical protein